jgi:hypothetical protein
MYIVEALRFGDREEYSYVVGVYDNLHAAYRAAVAEEYWRGRKYECVVTEYKLNADSQGESKEEWCASLPDDVFVSDVLVRVNQHLGFYNSATEE